MGRETYVNCARCNKRVRVRDDGTMGKHWRRETKAGRVRCEEGEKGRKPRPQRREVRVQITVMIPVEMTAMEYRAMAATLLRDQAMDAFVLDVEVDELEAAG